MIRRGWREGWLSSSIETLKTWAAWNEVKFTGINIGPVLGLEHRGSAVIAQVTASSEHRTPLLTIPKHLIVSLENIRTLAKSDRHLREVLDALGDYGKTPRGAILVFLLIQCTIACPVVQSIGVPNPFTQYVKYLRHENLPTFWDDEHLEYLTGTTLKPAVQAKVASLSREYDLLRSATKNISWCAQYWWDAEHGLLSFDDWKQVDAIYRSRALEFPGIGDCMVPCIDMANHSSGESATAKFEVNENGDVILLLREGKNVEVGDEITITYGDGKGACEMIFSYGFLEQSMESAQAMFLNLDIPDNDPLKWAKMAINTAAPGFRIVKAGRHTQWESDFVWLTCVNEEDGLGFKFLQTVDGGRELRALWKGEELQDPTHLKSLLESARLWNVFHLRAVSLIQDRVESQLIALQRSEGIEKFRFSVDVGPPRDVPGLLTIKLRKLEKEMLEVAYGDLEDQKLKLFETNIVTRYLESGETEGSLEDFA